MLPIGSSVRTQAPPPPPPPPPPPRAQVDNAVRAPALHGGQAGAPPPERYAMHTVARGETLSEIATRHQTSVPMLSAANPQLAPGGNAIDVGQQLNIPLGKGYGQLPVREVVEPGQTLTELAAQH